MIVATTCPKCGSGRTSAHDDRGDPFFACRCGHIWTPPRGLPRDNGDSAFNMNVPTGQTLGRETGRLELNPVPAPDLAEGSPITWHWQGYLAAGHITLLYGVPKSGKSTLIAHYLRSCAGGGHVATHVAAATVLVVSEESEGLWRRRCIALGVGAHAHFLCQPIRRMPDYPEWLRLVDAVTDLVARERYTVVIFDSLATLWAVKSENDAADVSRALVPLRKINDAGAGLLLVHHSRKSAGDEGVAARGSGAIAGFMDILMEFKRFRPADREDRRRVLATFSRFDESPLEVVLDYSEAGYAVIGSKADATRGDRLPDYQAVLPSEPPGLTVAEIVQAWGGTDSLKPSAKTVRRDLAGIEGVRTEGRGGRGDPRRYWIGAGQGIGTGAPFKNRGCPVPIPDCQQGQGQTGTTAALSLSSHDRGADDAA